MYEHNALGYWSGFALCLTMVRSSRARCPATALIMHVSVPNSCLHACVCSEDPTIVFMHMSVPMILPLFSCLPVTKTQQWTQQQQKKTNNNNNKLLGFENRHMKQLLCVGNLHMHENKFWVLGTDTCMKTIVRSWEHEQRL